jgi:xyloglucan 6-xylosyltransferase
MNHEVSGTMSRKVMGALNSYKATILCMFVTLLVLRGTMSGGSSGLGVVAFEMVEKESLADVEPTGVSRRVARKLTQVDDTSDEATAGKVVEEELWDRGKPYSLGPKITKWDEQRVVWNEQNPGMNASRGGKPKMLLVSGSQPGPCANPMGDFYHLKFLKNRVDYARLHGLEFFYNMATLTKEMSSFWAKLPLLRKLMLSHPDVEWIWWMDSDAIFTDMAFEVPMEKYEGMNLIVHGFHNLLFDQHRWIGLNTGSFLIRNCQWSLDLLDAWAPFGPEGETRVNAGTVSFGVFLEDPCLDCSLFAF